MKTSNLLFINLALMSFLHGCTGAGESEKMNPSRGFPIDTSVATADSIFTYSNIVLDGDADKNFGKLYWYISDKQVLRGHIVETIETCSDARFFVCIKGPIPIYLPREISALSSYNVGESSFELKFDKHILGENICDAEVVEFDLIDNQLNHYRYVMSKNSGLLYYSLTTEKGIKDGEMFRLSGSVFSYDEFCD